jgi:hypothetical protein
MLCPKPIGQPDRPLQKLGAGPASCENSRSSKFSSGKHPHVEKASNQSARQPTTWIPDSHARARDYGLF